MELAHLQGVPVLRPPVTWAYFANSAGTGRLPSSSSVFMGLASLAFAAVKKEKAIPAAPARPVLPILLAKG